ncbi:SEL1-like repeat protein [Roseibium sp. RKSG952]|uniref:SEL1-like repeat protein n=1 Tax=Roseibium sp. RKSG952 TaxID=2529384 RepID=UPI001AD8D5E2|nr:SEL1-like repeat protein [Roseibium sp. RKSG952]
MRSPTNHPAARKLQRATPVVAAAMLASLPFAGSPAIAQEAGGASEAPAAPVTTQPLTGDTIEGLPPVAGDQSAFAQPSLPSPLTAPLPQLVEGEEPTTDLAYGLFQRGWYLTALSIATPLAEAGDAPAQTLLGVLHETGYGIQQDKKKAADWYKLAAAKNDPQAALRLAQLYLVGDGVQQDKSRAADLFDIAAKAGNPNALYNLAIIYQEGDGRPYDADKALDYLRQSAQQNDPKAQYALGLAYMEGLNGLNDPGLGAFWLGRAARRGHTSAQVYYGILRFQGRGVDVDQAEAAAWFERAAASGNPVAMNRLAKIYAYGAGREQDLVKAAAWHYMARALGVDDLQLDDFVETLPNEVLEAARVEAERNTATLLPPSNDPSMASP